ncbi:GNAT family N-acetyltransferase [Marinitenerispora sediminis]|uniref:N-acetyltransferase n=1 Tax=Marinitenerispora sediminis TaxID=1931232 RepID=A0A368T508_9ACTN|nr:GNAT family N-acetyltransferase [Marinitenerispora sediminis]RCV53084.1 N-acetyltransferase [Marinitenerispora sediminis]RCV58538.1 N-acetyltransferase [Marinitenerispora sediminis]RCV58661.1 N-acetyltransferase [Marinitenerispora sediminis]
MHRAHGISYRRAGPDDQEWLAELDDSFTTDTVLEVAAGPGGFTVREALLDRPLTKTFPPDEDEWSPGVLVDAAVSGAAGCGFVAFEVTAWNRRLVVHEIAVAPGHRGRGIGAALMERACRYGRRNGARTAWLETSNVNVPAVRAYQRMGFALCGLDSSLYRGTPSEGEVALFMSRALDAG